ncbi:MAG: ribonuclease P protein component [Xanthomonadaceae bacterium]|jgi:ribonuclease P protein component|nr:ribonuclease P protein component [Xanthomonadaceae bacterium]
MNARFPASARVRKGREYRQTFAEGQRVATRCFSLHLRPRDGGFCRLGMAVSRKVSPDAVVRNRIKRQIRESFRQRRASLPAADFVVVARAAAAGLDAAGLRAELERLWARAAALPPAAPVGTIAAAAGDPASPSPTPNPTPPGASRAEGPSPA